MRNIELTAELKVMEKENQNSKREMEMLQGTIEDLKKEVSNLKNEAERGYNLGKRKETYVKIYSEHSSPSLEETQNRASEQSSRRLVQNTDEPLDEHDNLKHTSEKEIITKKKKEEMKMKNMNDEGKKINKNFWKNKDLERWPREIKAENRNKHKIFGKKDKYLPENTKEKSNYRNNGNKKEVSNEEPLSKREFRTKPKIIVKENIQLIPLFKERRERETADCVRVKEDENKWRIKTHKKRKEERIANNRINNNGKTITTDNKVKRRPPKTVAVAIKGEDGFSYADALKKACTEIFLKEIGINATKIRRAANGGIVIEIPGKTEKKPTYLRKNLDKYCRKKLK